ncbi:nucleotidyltransferase family protein [Leptothrix sp. BB-4]
MLTKPESPAADLRSTDSSFGLPVRTLDALRAVLAAEPCVSRVWVFGSRARGMHRPGSDIDLAIDAPGLGSAGLMRLTDAIDDLLLPQEVDLVLLDQVDDPGLLARIRADGRPLFDTQLRLS